MERPECKLSRVNFIIIMYFFKYSIFGEEEEKKRWNVFLLDLKYEKLRKKINENDFIFTYMTVT